MTLKAKKMLVDLILASLLAIAAVLITVLVHSIGVLIAIPFIEAAIYALWHAKNTLFAEPSIEVNVYERSITKVPVAKNSLKRDMKSEAVNEHHNSNIVSFFKSMKHKKTEAHNQNTLGKELR